MGSPAAVWGLVLDLELLPALQELQHQVEQAVLFCSGTAPFQTEPLGTEG